MKKNKFIDKYGCANIHLINNYYLRFPYDNLDYNYDSGVVIRLIKYNDYWSSEGEEINYNPQGNKKELEKLKLFFRKLYENV